MVAIHVAVEATFRDVVDSVLGVPVSFLIGHDPGAVRVDTNAVGGAESGRHDFGG